MLFLIAATRGCFQRAEALRVKQEEILSQREDRDTGTSHREEESEEMGGNGDEDSDIDDELLLELDWRAKHS